MLLLLPMSALYICGLTFHHDLFRSCSSSSWHLLPGSFSTQRLRWCSLGKKVMSKFFRTIICKVFYDLLWPAATSLGMWLSLAGSSLNETSVGHPASGKCYLASSHRKPRGAEVLLLNFDYFFISLRLGVFYHFTKRIPSSFWSYAPASFEIEKFFFFLIGI